jgi:hypothetical protein
MTTRMEATQTPVLFVWLTTVARQGAGAARMSSRCERRSADVEPWLSRQFRGTARMCATLSDVMSPARVGIDSFKSYVFNRSWLIQ